MAHAPRRAYSVTPVHVAYLTVLWACGAQAMWACGHVGMCGHVAIIRHVGSSIKQWGSEMRRQQKHGRSPVSFAELFCTADGPGVRACKPPLPRPRGTKRAASGPAPAGPPKRKRLSPGGVGNVATGRACHAPTGRACATRCPGMDARRQACQPRPQIKSGARPATRTKSAQASCQDTRAKATANARAKTSALKRPPCGGGASNCRCPQCHYRRFATQWRATYGSHKHLLNKTWVCTEWLAERGTGTTWGLGCLFCAHFLARLDRDRDPAVRHHKPRFGTKWARFEIRSSIQASNVQQHARQQTHKLAVAGFFSPERPLVRILQTSRSDEALLLGGVPQLSDWLHAWQVARHPVSYAAAAAFANTANFISQLRARAPPEKAIRDMVSIMAETSRGQKRDVLRKAWSISLSLDDRQAYRTISFRCATVEPCCSGLSEQARPSHCHKGLLWVLWRGGNADRRELEDTGEDHSKVIVDSVLTAITLFCTPLTGRSCDEGLRDHILKHTRQIAADGAPCLQKAIRMLRDRGMPNLVLIWRDPAHAVRKATHDPLKAEERFRTQFDRLFGARHALVPDIMNSDQWRQKLELCQKRVLREDRQLGGGLTHCLRHLSFAQQRWDSTAEPHRKLCCLVVPITMLLAVQVTDDRLDAKTRQRAQQTLDDLTPSALITSGLTADYTTECLRYIRKLEPASYDPARLVHDKQDFKQRMTTLFLEAHVLTRPDPAVGKTCTQIMLESVESAPPIYYGDRVKHLWHSQGSRSVAKVMRSLHVVVAAMLERLDAELHHADLMLCFEAFDVQAWASVVASDSAGERDDRQRALLAKARRLLLALSLDAERGVREFEGVAWALAKEHRDSVARPGTTGQTGLPDNPTQWSRVFQPGFARRVSCSTTFKVLPQLVAFYLSVTPGTGTLERDLGRLTRWLRAHVGPTTGDGLTAAAGLEVLLDGPARADDVAVHAMAELGLSGSGVVQGLASPAPPRNLARPGSAPGTASQGPPQGVVVAPCDALRFTSFSRRCAELWRSLHGRRFCTYRVDPHRTRGAGKKPGSDASVRRRCFAALDALVGSAPSAPSAHEHSTIFHGRNRAAFKRPAGQVLSDSGGWGPRLKKFRRTTEIKRQAKAMSEANRDANRNPYPHTPLRRGPLHPAQSKMPIRARGRPRKTGQKTQAAIAASASQPDAANRTRTVCVAAAAPLPGLSGKDRLVKPRGGHDYTRIASADVVVLDDVRDIGKRYDAEFLRTLVPIVATGRAVISASACKGQVPTSGLVRHKPACQTRRTIVLDDGFAGKHPRLTRMLKDVETQHGSKWTLQVNSAEAYKSVSGLTGVVRVSSLEDLGDFLNNARQLQRGRGVGGRYMTGRSPRTLQHV